MQECARQNHMPGHIQMYPIQCQVHRMKPLEHLIKRRLGVNQQSVMLRCKLTDNSPILIHQRPHRLVPIQFQKIGGHQDQTIEACPYLLDEVVEGLRVFCRRDMVPCLPRTTEVPPYIIDANHDSKPIRVQVKHIRLPASFEIANRVPSNAHIDDVDGMVWVRGGEGSIYQTNIAVPKRFIKRALTNGPFAPTVRNRISDEKQSTVRLEIHCQFLNRALIKMDVYVLCGLTIRLHPLGGCTVSTFATELTAMRVEQLKSREIAQSGASRGWATFWASN